MDPIVKQRLASSYVRFKFDCRELAQEAKDILEAKYPTRKIKISNGGSLFIHTNGSLLYEIQIISEIKALGGVLVRT